MNKYKLYCTTDNKWEKVIASGVPTKCPTNVAHTFDSNSITIIENNILINDGTPKEVTLSDYKKLRYNEINYNTGVLISVGFTYDSTTFGLSEKSEGYWNSLKNQETEFIWPMEISTIDNNTYSLTQANLGAFWTAGKDFIKSSLLCLVFMLSCRLFKICWYFILLIFQF